MFYQSTYNHPLQSRSFEQEGFVFSANKLFPKQNLHEHATLATLHEQISYYHKKLLEQKLLWQTMLKQQHYEEVAKQKFQLKSKNSVWDTVNLLERFIKPEYQTAQSKTDVLTADALHHAKEMALVEPITTFSYWHEVQTNETKGDGYIEDLEFMLHSFAQDIAEKGMNASRATIETTTFNRAKNALTIIAQGTDSQIKNSGILLTSFPDDKQSGYHGVDSKYNWKKPETHHTFFYLLRVGTVEKNQSGVVTRFEIQTTQFRAWPNASQAIELHKLLDAPLTQFDGPIPNLLFANIIHLGTKQLKNLVTQLQNRPENLAQKNLILQQDDNNLEQLFQLFLLEQSKQHTINTTQLPEVNQEEFWEMQKKYFNSFYLEVSLPVIDEITQLLQAKQLTSLQNLDLETLKTVQTKIDYLDKAFFYYSKVLMGWIKNHNTNPKYTEAFKEKNTVKKLLDFQQRVLLKILGQKKHNKIPSVPELRTALSIDHKLATKQKVSTDEKKTLLKIWGFFAYAGNFSSLIQCGAVAPFSMPISIMNKAFNASTSLPEFSNALNVISVPEQQQFLTLLESEEYVELDLRSQGANRVYTVPRSYLDEPGCIVNENGAVLGPCFEPVIKDGIATKARIPLDDPRDTLAFPMTLPEFNQYVRKLKTNIEASTLQELDTIFESSDFSSQDKRKAKVAIKKLRQKMIKKTLGLQEFVTGDLTNAEFSSNNAWLKLLLIKLSFSQNPIQTLVTEVEMKLKENDSTIQQILEN